MLSQQKKPVLRKNEINPKEEFDKYLTEEKILLNINERNIDEKTILEGIRRERKKRDEELKERVKKEMKKKISTELKKIKRKERQKRKKK